jgi:predicted PurR-regulated permease PerM
LKGAAIRVAAQWDSFFTVYLLLSLVLVSILAAAFQQAQNLVSNRETYSRQVTTLVESNRQKLRDSKLPAAMRQSIDEGIDKSLERLQRDAPTYASNAATWAVGSLGWLFITVFCSIW